MQREFLNQVIEGLNVGDCGSKDRPVSFCVRFDGRGHQLEDEGGIGRCKKGNKASARVVCCKCRVRLHRKCEAFYDSRLPDSCF